MPARRIVRIASPRLRCFDASRVRPARPVADQGGISAARSASSRSRGDAMRIAPAGLDGCKPHGLYIQIVLARRPAVDKPHGVQPLHEERLTTREGKRHKTLHIDSRTIGRIREDRSQGGWAEEVPEIDPQRFAVGNEGYLPIMATPTPAANPDRLLDPSRE